MAITISSSANLTAWEDTSSTSNAMPTSTATKSYTVSTSKNFLAGDTIQATALLASIPTGIIGTVSSYSGSSLVIAPNNSVATNATLCGVYGLIWSKTTVTNGTGAKTLNVSFNPYKVNAGALVSGLAIRVHSRVAPFTNFMVGTVTSYTITTGALVLNITSATGAASISDWVICQDGTFTSWDISPQWGDTFTITGASQLSITQTPKMSFKFVTATTNGQLRVTNNNTSTMLLLYGSEPTGSNSPTNTALRFESNALLYVKGDFIVIGTATGGANETFAIPSGIDYPSYVEVETAVGSGVYEPWKIGPISYHDSIQNTMIVRKSEISTNSNEATKWLFYNPVTRNIESGDGTTGGIRLTSGVRVRIPNIHISCDQASPNVILSGTGAQDCNITGSVATGNGAKSFTVPTGLSYVAADNVLLEYPGAPGVYLTGTVTAYTSGTGAMTFNATGSQGTFTGSGWILRDQRGTLTVGDWSANSSTTTTNGRLYSTGEILSSASRTNGGFTGIGRNNQKEWSISSIISAGSLLWYHGDAPGSTGNGTRRWQIDTAPSGSVYLENCSIHFLSLDLTDYSSFTALRVGVEHTFIRSTLGSTALNRVHCASVSSVKQYHGIRATSLVGNTSLQNIFTWTDAPDPVGNATTCFNISNAANVSVWNNIQGFNTSRQRSLSVITLDTVTFAPGVTPTNTYIVGSMNATGLSNQEWEGFYVANKMNGNVGETGESGVQHVSLSRSSNLVMRKFRSLGNMKLVNNQMFSGDAFSNNIILHDGDFSANNNATSMVGMLSNSGTSNLIIAGWNMGSVATTFVNNLNRAVSGLVERNVLYRNIIANTQPGYQDNVGTPYSNGLFIEKLTGGASYMRSSPVSNLTNPSYKDCANFYTYIDPSATTGRLSIGTFSGQAQLDLYNLSGTSYVNNAGLLYFEGAGDSAIIKTPYAIRGITSFVNVDPIIQDSRNTYTTSATSNTIGLGALTFTTGSGFAFQPGDTITIWALSDIRQWMSGTVTSYSTTTLIVNITAISGSGTFASWGFKSNYQTESTYEFRTCQWGQDITASAWQTLNRTNLSAVSIADSTVGINLHIRVTGNGAVSGRFLQQILIEANYNSSFNPAVTTYDIAASGLVTGSLYAIYDTTSGSSLVSSLISVSSSEKITVPGKLYGSSTPISVNVRKYGYLPFLINSSYYNTGLSVPVAQTVDSGITQLNSATVSAYTTLEVGQKVYDYYRYFESLLTNFGFYNVIVKAGSILDAGSYNVVISDIAVNPLSIVGNTITIKALQLNADSFTTLTTTGTITFSGSSILGSMKLLGSNGTFNQLTGTFTGYALGSRIQIYNFSTGTELYNGVPGSTTFTYTYLEGSTITSGNSIRVRKAYVSGTTAHLAEEYFVTATTLGWSLEDDNSLDTVYNSLGINGAGVSGFGADYINNEVNVTIGVDWYLSDLYAWWVYNLTTSQGIAQFLGGITAVDLANFRINNDIVNIYIDNNTAVNIKQLDNRRIYRSDGAYPVKSSGGGGMDVVWRNTILIAETNTSGLTVSEAATLAKLDVLTENVSGLRFTAKALEQAPVTSLATIESSSILAKEATVASRLAAASYIAPDNTSITAIKTKTDNLPSNTATAISAIPTNTLLSTDSRLNNLDASIASRLASASYTTPPSISAIVDGVWDEQLTGATHNVPTSAGRRLRQVTAGIITEDVAAGAGANSNQIVLGSTASSTDGAYDPGLITIIGGAGAGQSRIILQYDGATKTATVNRDWKTPVNNTSEYVIHGYADIQSVNEGLVRGATSNTIVLNANASTVNDTYVGQIVFIVSGNGADQTAIVTAYNGSTQTATIAGSWKTIPDTTSGYAMLPVSPVLLAAANHSGAIIPTVTTVTNYTAPDNTTISAIKTKVDTLNNTDLTGIATTANVTSAQNAIITEVNANEVKIDSVKTVVDILNTNNPPTLAQIEASTILAKQATLNKVKGLVTNLQ